MRNEGLEIPEWPRYLGRPDVTAQLRTLAEDFQVWELPLVEPQGSGSHLWLEVRKRGANTRWVASQLAAAAGVPLRDVGFAGMKDRRAVTTQWFSIGLQEAANADFPSWQIPGIEILQAHRHGRKLQRGALRGNRFQILLRELSGGMDALPERLVAVARDGFPNYFGPQRFGHGGANVQRAAQWLGQGRRIKRQQRSLYLSAARSFLFNLVLAERVRLGTWNRLLDGDVVVLDGSRSTFGCILPDAELERRCATFDIHPTGPLPGRAGKKARNNVSAAAASLEHAVLSRHEALCETLCREGVEADRRSLRVLPVNLEWRAQGSDLLLTFELPPGAYATSLLRELVLTAPDTISEEE
jgi:tRNA pseudouridine13 synthase